MPCILHIETATDVCSVALSIDGTVTGKISSQEPRAHSSKLTIFIRQLLAKDGIKMAGLDAVSVSRGPGSYTGLRIGVSVAKGLAYALEKPLIAVDTLRCFSMAAAKDSPEGGLFCPMIDARRMEVYCAIYDSLANEVKPTTALVIDENSFTGLLSERVITFFGDGMEKCRHLLGRFTNARFVDDFLPDAAFQASLALKAFDESRFEDIAAFEPLYLKDFVAQKPGAKVQRVLKGR